MRTAEETLKNKNVPYEKVYTNPEIINALFVEGHDPNLGLAVRDIADKTLPQYSFSAMGEGRFKLELKKAEEQDLRDKAIQQSVEVIRNRIDKYGVSETAIHRQGLGSNKIVVELPGVEDSTEIKALIGTAARLEWPWAWTQAGAPDGKPSRSSIARRFPEDVASTPAARESFGSQNFTSHSRPRPSLRAATCRKCA